MRILAGQGVGHEGIITAQNGSSVKVSVPSMNGLCVGQALLTIRRRDLQVVRSLDELKRVASFRPYVPARWCVPRAGSDIASRLPSVVGAELVYPAGLRG